MIDSKAFPENDLENISAHCFRATLAAKKYREGGAITAQRALNHKNASTTLSHYIKINDRGIELDEEKQYIKNKNINSDFNFFKKNISIKKYPKIVIQKKVNYQMILIQIIY